MIQVCVNLPSNAYPIYIEENNLKATGSIIKAMNFSPKCMIITDKQVGALYGNIVKDSLAAQGISTAFVAVSPGEQAKSFSNMENLITAAITHGLERQSPIIALGGGVVGDLAGFVAATYLRGVPFIQIPTSLLAQVDSSVGGKVAINHTLGKNLLGAFYQPQCVIIDIQTLQTLDDQEYVAGLAEVIKYGAILDKTFYCSLDSEYTAILARDNSALIDVVQKSCLIKAQIVETDEKENGPRILLNFGHTIGHAVESLTGFKRYRHGEAVAIGMYGAALISYYQGLCDKTVVSALKSLLERFGLPIQAGNMDIQELIECMSRDKKISGGAIRWVLLKELGEAVVTKEVSISIVRKALEEIIK